MAHEETVMRLMNKLVYATKHDVGDLMAHDGVWKAGPSSVNNAYKFLTQLTESGLLEKGEGFFKLKGYKGNHEEHSRLVTAELVKILKLPYETIIIREAFIGDVSLIPDAMILTIDGDMAACWILEVMHNETPEYFQQKVHVWEAWEEANGYLSELFGYQVKSFNIINKAEEIEGGNYGY